MCVFCLIYCKCSSTGSILFVQLIIHLKISRYRPIGHFLVVFCLCSKTILGAKIHMKMRSYPQFNFHANQTHFRMKGFSRALVLKAVGDQPFTRKTLFMALFRYEH